MKEILQSKPATRFGNFYRGQVSRRGFLKGIGAAAMMAAAGCTDIEQRRRISSHRSLKSICKGKSVTTYALIDETIVAQAFAMRRESPSPAAVVDGPILSPAWAYGSVIREPSGLFRMWYLAPPCYCEYYATSMDGIRWDKPTFNLVSPELDAGPNAIMSINQRDKNGRWLVTDPGPEGFGVLDAEIQPHPAAKTRFTCLYLAACGKDEKGNVVDGLCIAYSEDGIHWVADEHNPVVPGWHDTSNCLVYDESTGKYLIFGRPPVYVELGRHANRLISRMESDDLIHWSSPYVILDSDDRDANAFSLTDEGKLKKDKPAKIVSKRGRDRQFYGMTAFRDCGIYVGLAQVYDIPSGQTWLELVHSHDSKHWIREALREPYIGPRPGTWESIQVRPAMASPPVRVGAELWIYYSASPHTHHAGKAFEGRAIGIRAIKTDRWVRYRSVDKEAELLTHPFKSGGRIFLNASTEKSGWIRVSVVDSWGRAIEGLSHMDCQTLTGDDLRHEVRWRKGTTMSKLPDQVRLRIRNRNASVFAFYVASA